jgi:hypothetical protein
MVLDQLQKEGQYRHGNCIARKFLAIVKSMKAIIALSALTLLGCHGKVRSYLDERKLKAALEVPAPPSGASACTPTEPKKLEQGLQTKNPIPAVMLADGKAYNVVWVRAESVDVPDEAPTTAPSSEIGPIQTVKVTNNPKATLEIDRLTSERSGTSKLSFAQQGAISSYFFEDEFGVHFSQRTNHKPSGLTFDIVGGHSPSVLNSKGGVWMFWASTCEGGGEIKFLKVAKESSPDAARKQPADGILCGRGHLYCDQW